MYDLDEIIVTEDELINKLECYFSKDWKLTVKPSLCTNLDGFVKKYIDYYINHFDYKTSQIELLYNFYKSQNINLCSSMYIHCLYFFKIPSTNNYLLLDLSKDATKNKDKYREYQFDSILKLIPLDNRIFETIYNTLNWYKDGNLIEEITKKNEVINNITFEQSVSKVYPTYSEVTANILNFIKNRLKYFVIGKVRWNKLDSSIQNFLISGDYNYYLIKNLKEEYITPSIIATSWASAIERLLKKTVYYKLVTIYLGNVESKNVDIIIKNNRKTKDIRTIDDIKDFTLGTMGYILEKNKDVFINFYKENYSYDGDLSNDLDDLKELLFEIVKLRNDVAHGLEKDLIDVERCYKKLYFMDGKVKALIILLIDLFY